MSELILPETIASQLQGLSEIVHFLDPSGKKLGIFVPALDPSQYEDLEPDLSDEELRQIEESTEWYSTEEVLRHLEKLA